MCDFFKKLYYSKHPGRCKCSKRTRKLEVVKRAIGRNYVYDIYGVEACKYCGQTYMSKRIVKDISVKRPEELDNAMAIAKREWLDA